MLDTIGVNKAKIYPEIDEVADYIKIFSTSYEKSMILVCDYYR